MAPLLVSFDGCFIIKIADTSLLPSPPPSLLFEISFSGFDTLRLLVLVVCEGGVM